MITFLLLLFLNFICLAILHFITPNPVESYYSYLKDEYINYRAYTDPSLALKRDTTYIETVLNEYAQADNQGRMYYPATEFIEIPFESKYTNIETTDVSLPHRRGYKDPSKPHDINTLYIYAFGGSTTQGSFVADNDTWPSLLCLHANEQLNNKVVVVNLGYLGFTPTQETSLFLSLLKLGYRPSAAIFLDGLNTGPKEDVSALSKKIAHNFSKLQNQEPYLIRLASLLPMVQLYNHVSGEGNEAIDDVPEDHPLIGASVTQTSISQIVERFVQNHHLRSMIGNMYQVPVVQVLQPNAIFGYSPDFFTPAQQIQYSGAQEMAKHYQSMYNQVLSRTQFIDMSNLLTEYNKPALVDFVHYSPSFNQYLAQEIFQKIQWVELKPYRKEPIGTGNSF